MILITGASSGIGEATAIALAQSGRDVFLVARRADRLKSLSETLKRSHSAQVEWSELDLADENACESWLVSNEDLLSRCEAAVLNAGLAKGMKPLQEGSLLEWKQMLDVNVRSVLQFSQALLKMWLKSETRGHLVLLGSVAARWHYPNGNVYSATKAAIHALAQSIRLDVQGSGIRVTEVSPGMVETEFSRVRLGDVEKAKAVYRGMTPLSAQDIADSIVWAMSRPAHVNVQELVIYPTDQASPNHVSRR